MLTQGHVVQLNPHQPPISLLVPSFVPQQLRPILPQSLRLTSATRTHEDVCLSGNAKSSPLCESHIRSAENEDFQRQSSAPQEICDIFSDCYLNTDLATYTEAYYLVCRDGLESDNFLGSRLISMLSESGKVLEATRIFVKLNDPDVFAWCAFISAYAENGQEKQAISLYYRMCLSDIKPDGHIFRVVLKACASASALIDGRVIHLHIIYYSIECNIFVGSALLDMYIKCQRLNDAHGVFEDMPEQDVVTWSTLLAGYACDGLGKEALELFHQMQEEGIQPSPITFIGVLKACSSTSSLEQGQLTHCSIIQNGYETNVYLANSLIDMYSSCGSFEDAGITFDKHPSKDVGTWNTMIGSCAQHGRMEEAFCLFQVMQDEGVKPVHTTFVNILKTCADGAALEKGRIVHANATEYGIELDVYVGSMLVHVYVKCGCLWEARDVFEKLPSVNVVTWGTIIGGYAQYGLGMEALCLFKQMQEAGLELDQGIFVVVLKATTSLCSLDQGHVVHGLAIEWDFEHDEVVGNALISMYAACGSIDDGLSLFNRRPDRNTSAWNALISGLALNQRDYAHGQKALMVFQHMLGESVKPDQVTFLGLLKICSSLSALNQGSLIHAFLVESGLDLGVVVGNTLIDMYSKCGSLDDACCILNRLPTRDTITYNAMIEGLGQSRHAKQALLLFEQMQKDGMKVNDSTFVSLLSACSHDRLIKEGYHFFKLMEVYGIVPKIDHYDLLVDLTGRAGFLVEAEDLLETMPLSTDFVGWMSLLTHCNTHTNVDLGRRCFNNAVSLDSENASSYVLMSNLYANAGMWEAAERLEDIRKGTTGAVKKPGKALIEIGNEVHEFTVGGKSHPCSDAIYAKLKELIPRVKNEGYRPQFSMVPGLAPNEEKETSLWEHCERLAIAFGLVSTAEGTTIRVSKNLRVCSDCHIATKIISKIEKREIFIMDTYRIHHFQGGECSCNELF